MRWSAMAATLEGAAFFMRAKPQGFCATVDPRLRCNYVPRLHLPKDRGRGGRRLRVQLAIPGVFRPSDRGSDPGLAHSPKFGSPLRLLGMPPRRYGLKGITRYALRRIRAGARLLEEDRKLCAFWTIKLSDRDVLQLVLLDAWDQFVNTLRHRVLQSLRRRGYGALLVGVVEVHPERSMRVGWCIPHLHILFRAKRWRGDQWAFSPEQLDGFIGRALEAVGVVDPDLRATSTVQPIKSSAAGYLSKYMSKTEESATFHAEEAGLLPRQWFVMSRPLLQWIRACTVMLPGRFLEWLCNVAEENRPGQLYHVCNVKGLPERAPPCYAFSFRSPQALWKLWEDYERSYMMVFVAKP